MGIFAKMRLFWALLIILIVIFGVFMLRNNQETYQEQEVTPPQEEEIIDLNAGEENTEQEETVEENIDVTTEEPTGISIQELAMHKDEDSCWIVFENKVYDIASYLPRHPGGKNKILNTCGDPEKFEVDFAEEHGTSKVSLLMKVGVLIGDFDVVGNLQT